MEESQKIFVSVSSSSLVKMNDRAGPSSLCSLVFLNQLSVWLWKLQTLENCTYEWKIKLFQPPKTGESASINFFKNSLFWFQTLVQVWHALAMGWLWRSKKKHITSLTPVNCTSDMVHAELQRIQHTSFSVHLWMTAGRWWTRQSTPLSSGMKYKQMPWLSTMPSLELMT